MVGNEGDAVLAAQLVAQFLDGVDDFQGNSPGLGAAPPADQAATAATLV